MEPLAGAVVVDIVSSLHDKALTHTSNSLKWGLAPVSGSVIKVLNTNVQIGSVIFFCRELNVVSHCCGIYSTHGCYRRSWNY